MPQKTATGRAGIWACVGVAALLLMPLFLSRFYVYLASLVILYGLFATSLNIALGYGGIYQFGHAIFFGAGAYGAALIITKAGLSPWVGFVVGPLVSVALSVVIGLICIRLSKLYFGMLQISLSYLLWIIAYRWRDFTGGENGIHGIAVPDVISSPKGTYYFTLLITAASLFVVYRMIKSPFGSALQGVRDNPLRSEMIGVNVRRHQLAALAYSGFFAGIAGVLFVAVDNAVFPNMLFWTLGMEAMIMCLLGGMYTFAGPMLGAALIVLLRTFVGSFTVYWGLFIGSILVAVIFFLPDGIMGRFQRTGRRIVDSAKEEACYK